MKDYFSCIVPFFNECGRVDKVVNPLSKSKLISEIIAVDDGSTDGGSESIKVLPKVKVLRLNSNMGKTQAVTSGLKEVSNGRLIIVDADLKNLTTKEVDRTLSTFNVEKSIDMIILKISGSNSFTDNLLRKYIFQAGNRIIKKGDLEKQ